MEGAAEVKTSRSGLVVVVVILVLFVGLAARVALPFAIRFAIGRPYVVPSAGMAPTIVPGDRVLVRPTQSVAAGDIVVFRDPTGQSAQLIKRVVALPGQTVDIRGGAVYVNGMKLNEPYVAGAATRPGTAALPATVPAGDVWVLGDNRPNSADSRYIGPIAESSILGRAVLVYWPATHLKGL